MNLPPLGGYVPATEAAERGVLDGVEPEVPKVEVDVMTAADEIISYLFETNWRPEPTPRMVSARVNHEKLAGKDIRISPEDELTVDGEPATYTDAMVLRALREDVYELRYDLNIPKDTAYNKRILAFKDRMDAAMRGVFDDPRFNPNGTVHVAGENVDFYRNRDLRNVLRWGLERELNRTAGAALKVLIEDEDMRASMDPNLLREMQGRYLFSAIRDGLDKKFNDVCAAPESLRTYKAMEAEEDARQKAWFEDAVNRNTPIAVLTLDELREVGLDDEAALRRRVHMATHNLNDHLPCSTYSRDVIAGNLHMKKVGEERFYWQTFLKFVMTDEGLEVYLVKPEESSLHHDRHPRHYWGEEELTF